MLSITNGGSLSRALSSLTDRRLTHLLSSRAIHLGGVIERRATFILVQPTDPPEEVACTLGFSPLTNPVDGATYGHPDFTPAWEWAEDHGFCFELVFILDDSGFAHVLFVEQPDGADSELLRLCRAFVPERV